MEAASHPMGYARIGCTSRVQSSPLSGLTYTMLLSPAVPAVSVQYGW